EGKYADRLPTLRTVQRIVSERTPRDNSGPWTLGTADTVHARVVLDVLAAVVDETEGHNASFTQEEAKWGVQVSAVAPDLPPYERWRIARLYMGRASRGEPMDDLDGFLAYAPWRDGEAGWKRYNDAVEAGWVRHVPHFLSSNLEHGLREGLFSSVLRSE